MRFTNDLAKNLFIGSFITGKEGNMKVIFHHFSPI